MPEPKAKMWRIWAEFDEGKKECPAVEFVEAHCRMISELYGGQVTSEELLNELELSEVMPIYREATDYLTKLLYARFETLGKKSADAAAQS